MQAPVANSFQHYLYNGLKETKLKISSEQQKLMVEYCKLLMLWNKKINLTAIKKPKEIAEKHFIDCLLIIGFIDNGISLLDLGTGGGFPGIIVKIMRPSAKIVLLDSVRKKVNFLNHVIRVLELENIKAVHARAQDLKKDQLYAQQFDAVISRAFADLNLYVELAKPFLKKGGVIYAMKGKHGHHEAGKDILEQYNIDSDYYQLPFDKAERTFIQLSDKRP